MADRTDEVCARCGKEGLLFCDNQFTDWYCKNCGATNLECRIKGYKR
jgi:hypothetical protein